MKMEILGKTFPELQDWLVKELNQKPFRAKQLYSWLHIRRVTSFAEMTNLSIKFRELLEKEAYITKPTQTDQLQSDDGTTKYLLKFSGGSSEAVLIPEAPRYTVCLSTQYGCKMDCKFCMTGMAGFHGNMSAGEIVSQLYFITNNSEERISNIVFMGMGEPMDNWEAVKPALEIFSGENGICIGQRKITVSTVGLPGGIQKLLAMNKQFGLAVSLHSAIQSTREKIIPSAKVMSLDQLKSDMLKYTNLTGRRVTLEYCLIENTNDSIKEAEALALYSRRLPCKINILVYNPIPGLNWKAPSEKVINQFVEYLYPRCQAVTVRRSRGSEVAGACGQLGASVLQKEEPNL